jgi:hypothetical protein
MLKKTQLGEKLRKLKIEGTGLEKSAAKRASAKTPNLVAVSENRPEIKTAKVEEPVISIAKEETEPQKIRIKRRISIRKVKREEGLMHVKKAEEIEDRKPEEIIEPLISEKRELAFISDLAIPAQKLSKLFKVETTYTEDTLNQILTAWKDPEKIIKWTAKLDKHGQEFYSLKGEGLMKMKDKPPIYGMELDDGAIIATHMGEYTFIMGCYNFDVKTLVKIFAFGVDNAKQYNL